MNKFKVIDGHLTDVRYRGRGSFDCSGKNLTSLDGCPKVVKGDFFCFENQLTNLKGSPKIVKGFFSCYSNKLTSLEGSPEEVGPFYCIKNQLTNLKGSPKVVNGWFNCSKNHLTTLEGCPEVVNGPFDCSCNPDLEDISDLPESVDVLNIWGCSKIKVFSKHINDTLRVEGISEEVLERLK